MGTDAPGYPARLQGRERYGGIDIGKFIFACLIPLLHIGIPDSPLITVVRQYLSRLGVPFFFAAGGFIMSRSIRKRGRTAACKRYLLRVGRMLVIWLVIYSVPLFVSLRSEPAPFRELLFRTPAYLWYLTALLFASVPFCLVENRQALWVISGVLYLAGTLLGGSYSWLTGGWPAYEALFITTRNGLFFGLPMLCVGEAAGLRMEKGKTRGVLGLAAAGVLLASEISFVLSKIDLRSGVDCSMYLTLPLFSYYLFVCLAKWPVERDTMFFRKASVAIYVMQYGVITVFNIILSRLGIPFGSACWLIYVGVILCGCLAAWAGRKNKWINALF